MRLISIEASQAMMVCEKRILPLIGLLFFFLGGGGGVGITDWFEVKRLYL